MNDQKPPKTAQKAILTNESVQRRRNALLEAMRRDVQIVRKIVEGKSVQRAK